MRTTLTTPVPTRDPVDPEKADAAYLAVFLGSAVGASGGKLAEIAIDRVRSSLARRAKAKRRKEEAIFGRPRDDPRSQIAWSGAGGGGKTTRHQVLIGRIGRQHVRLYVAYATAAQHHAALLAWTVVQASLEADTDSDRFVEYACDATTQPVVWRPRGESRLPKPMTPEELEEILRCADRPLSSVAASQAEGEQPPENGPQVTVG
jgi:hypothetical protein